MRSLQSIPAVHLPRNRFSPIANRIGPLRDVNALCLDWMIEALGAAQQPNRSLLGDCGGLLAALTAEQRDAVAQFPFLLVNMKLQRPLWWAEIARHPTLPTTVPTWLAGMPRESAIRLARGTLVLAWHTSRVDCDSAVVVLGLHPDTVAILTSLNLLDIDKIAEHHYLHLRPRWEDQPSMWRHILMAAQSAHAGLNNDIVLRALQLAAGTYISTR